MKFISLTLCICFFFCGFVISQEANKSTFLSVNDGLSQGMVFDILQSRDGYIWIATKHGLNRYDGYNFKVYTPDAFDPFAIGGGEIRRLFEDSRGWIWINYLNGLDVFDPKSGLFFHLNGPDFPIYTGKEAKISPLTFAESSDGSVWITDFNQLWQVVLTKDALDKAFKSGNAYPKYNIINISLPELPGSNGKHITTNSVYFSNKHGLLIGSSHGLHLLDSLDHSLRLIALHDKYLRIAGEDDTGVIWLKVISDSYPIMDYTLFNEDDDLHGKFELQTWDGQSTDKLHITTTYPNLVHFDKGTHIWIVQRNLIQRWNIRDLRNERLPNFQQVITRSQPIDHAINFQAITTDASGLLWLATNGYGIVKLSTEKPKFRSYLPLRSQRTLYEDPNGNIYTFIDPYQIHPKGDFGHSLPNPWHSNEKTYEHFFPFVFDTNGDGWGNTNVGQIFQKDALSYYLRKFPFEAVGLIYTRNKKFLGVNQTGLVQFDPITMKVTTYPFKEINASGNIDLHLHQLYESKDGTIWIFAFEGLIRATPTENGFQFTQFKNDTKNAGSLSSDLILSVADDPIDPYKYLWVGTKGGGLNRLDKTSGECKHYNTDHGLPNNVVYGILSDNQGHIWLSTNKGLCRFHVREETVKNFTVADGLQDNEFNTGSYLKTKSGQLIFGGINGLTVFNPDSIQYNTRLPTTRIVRFSTSQNNYYSFSDEKIRLSHRDNFVSFEFSALDFSSPEQNMYRYNLDKKGVFGTKSSKGWTDLNHQNSIQFANLAPGKYTFQVIGSNNDGFWSENPATFNFTILPPWYASSWVYLLYIISLSILALFIHRFQLNRKFEQQEALRLKELDEFKNRFFTNLTHEFRTPLTVILGMAQQIRIEPKKQIKDRIHLIEKNGKDLLHLINQLLDLAKLESGFFTLSMQQGDIVPYIRYLVETFQSFALGKDISISFSSTEPSLLMDFDPEQLKQVLTNLIANAVKFTSSGGEINVMLTIDKKNYLEIKVEDTGEGIDAAHIPYIFDQFYQVDNKYARSGEGSGIGLAHASELVKLMGGSISVESIRGEGTCFSVLLPIQNEAPQSDLYNDEPAITPTLLSNYTDQISSNQNSLSIDDSLPSVLIIEDNHHIMAYLRTILENHYRLDMAFDGVQGIEKAWDQIPDLIISDVMMPEKDGFEVCETLKNDHRTSHIPIVLLTAKSGVENRITGLSRGADAYIAKPFDKEELLVQIESLLERQKRMALYFSSKSNQTIPAEISEVIQVEDAFVQKIRQIVEENYKNEDFGLPELCQKLGMSRSQLFRKMKAVLNQSPSNFIRSFRLQKARSLLEKSDISVSEVAWNVGYKNLAHFSTSYLEEFGFSPSDTIK